MRILFGTALIAAIVASPALAQTHAVPDRNCARENRCHEFGGAEVDGKPAPVSGAYQIGQTRAKFENRIKQRTSFEPELQRSVDRL